MWVMLHEELTTGQAAKYISRHPKTLQAMDWAGVVPARRTASGRRYGWRRIWSATWEEQRRSERDAGCAMAACHPPGLEEAAADRGRVCHRPRYGQSGVYRGN